MNSPDKRYHPYIFEKFKQMKGLLDSMIISSPPTVTEDSSLIETNLLLMPENNLDVNSDCSNFRNKSRMNCVEIAERLTSKGCSAPWFHGGISREDADRLIQPRVDGMFLVRESMNFPGDYTLALSFHNNVQHYKIISQGNQLSIDEEEFFENLEALIDSTM